MRLYYGGIVRHQAHSDEGMIEVVDLGDTRSMHFGTFPRQSSMSLRVPHRLELGYTESMMACLLFNPKPRHILVIGLGGGSVVKFLLHYFPDCKIDVVEYRADVIAVAREFFEVPEQDQLARLTIHHGDGGVFIEEQAAGKYDLLLVDAYDDTGMTESVAAQSFFDDCAKVLSAEGVMSMNLWGSEHALFAQTMERINRSFDRQTMNLPVKNKGNVISLATKQAVKQADLKDLRTKAQQQGIELEMDMMGLLHQLQRQNTSFMKRLFAY